MSKKGDEKVMEKCRNAERSPYLFHAHANVPTHFLHLEKQRNTVHIHMQAIYCYCICFGRHDYLRARFFPPVKTIASKVRAGHRKPYWRWQRLI